MSRPLPKARRNPNAAAPAAAQSSEAMLRFQVGLGYAIVAIAVALGFVMSFAPRVFGQQSSNPAIGFGLAALAGFRLFALRRELRRQAKDLPGQPSCRP